MSHHGQQNVAGQVEVMELTESSRLQLQKHQATLFDLEAKKVAATIDVPTLPNEVRSALRELGQPVRLFGENLADVRQRLRMELARRQVSAQQLEEGEQEPVKEEEEEEVTKYTRASEAIIEARQAIATFSMERASRRLEAERKLRALAARRKRRQDEKEQADTELAQLDNQCIKTYRSLRHAALEGSQYGDDRALSCICTKSVAGIPLVASASWTGNVQLWDGSSPALEPVGEKSMCHEDRIMGMDMMVNQDGETAMLATTSIDLTAKLWKVRKSDVVMSDEDKHEKQRVFTITEHAHLKGHSSRLCRAAFHPMKRHVATTSFDYSWRLWDVETGQELLLQDGHWKECYGIGFHPDGSLCATTDFAGVVQVWDLRSGKSIKHFLGHVKRVLNADFHPNGFQLATAGDDGTIRIWDLRRRKQAASLPAHSNLITKLCFDPSGEFMASSSFDGTGKLWSCRDWKMLTQLQGHEGKVTGIDIMENNACVTCGWDKTLKMWG